MEKKITIRNAGEITEIHNEVRGLRKKYSQGILMTREAERKY